MLLPLISWSQEEVVIEAFESSGEIQFTKISNAVSYRIEWASAPGGNWTNFSIGAAYLDEIVSPGLGTATASVPMVYRVVATVTNPPPSGMSLIPAGEFVMGDTQGEGGGHELPLHTNNIRAIYMDKHEVTKALWDEVLAFNGSNGYIYANTGQGKATNHPVQTVNWYDAVKWCNARSEMEGLTPVYYTDAGFTTVYKSGEIAPAANLAANGYRLPTEAEWEKAARGGLEGKRFPWGDTITHSNANYLSSIASAYDTSSTRGQHPSFATNGTPYTSPVGYFAPNGYGLYDMAGNVWEWCWDWFSSSYYSSSSSDDPQGPSNGSLRVLRGGSWDSTAVNIRVANRVSYDPVDKRDHIGFRCARGL
jgi:formylglycine-generating enzyme required for sulfatase activity